MTRIRVGVLRGGPSSEYEVSLKTGHNVLSHFQDMSSQYASSDIFISRDGIWHLHGLPQKPYKILKNFDVVFNALHGEYGEDGLIQRELDAVGIPYTGSGALSSALGMNKVLAKEIFKKHGLKTPEYVILREGEDTQEKVFDIFKYFAQPSIIKPASAGSSVGVTLATDWQSFKAGIANAFVHSPIVIVEEFIRGREATCGVIDDFRGQSVYSLLPVEIVKPKESKFFDFNAKYSGEAHEICPGNFSHAEREMIEDVARKVHQSLGLRHYSRTDMIVHPRKGVYVLEVNTLPGLTKESLFPKSLKAIGCSMHNFLDHLVKLAMGKNGI